jgi:hypothetical protein
VVASTDLLANILLASDKDKKSIQTLLLAGIKRSSEISSYLLNG